MILNGALKMNLHHDHRLISDARWDLLGFWGVIKSALRLLRFGEEYSTKHAPHLLRISHGEGGSGLLQKLSGIENSHGI